MAPRSDVYLEWSVMRGVKRRVSRKSGLFVLLALFAWLFLVLVILPRRRQEAALAVDDARAGAHEFTGNELATQAPEEPKPLADDADLAVWDRVPTAPDLADPTAPALAAVPDTPADDLEVQPDVQSAFNQNGSSDIRDELLRRLRDAHASDVDFSLDPKPIVTQAAPPRAVGRDDAQLGVRVYLAAFWRFRWLIPVAVCAAILVPLLMLYRPVWPPGLEARSTVSYVTTAQLLVDSPSGPFLRTETTSSDRSVAPVTPGSETPAQSGPQSFEKKSLVDAANLFPLLMESDEIVAVRRKLIGNVPGTVRATALYASRGANRYRPSVLPVMQIIAVAPDPKGAVRLGQGTARAFRIWLEREQNRTKVATSERIVVRQLRRPSTAVQIGGPGYSMPILAGLAMLGAFVGLAVAIDRALPRVRVGQPSMGSLDGVPSGQDGSEAWPVDPPASTRESPYSPSLWRISETLTEARAGSEPG
jgi:hypothetical protein